MILDLLFWFPFSWLDGGTEEARRVPGFSKKGNRLWEVERWRLLGKDWETVKARRRQDLRPYSLGVGLGDRK
jgi:hypothetical protein